MVSPPNEGLSQREGAEGSTQAFVFGASSASGARCSKCKKVTSIDMDGNSLVRDSMQHSGEDPLFLMLLLLFKGENCLGLVFNQVHTGLRKD